MEDIPNEDPTVSMYSPMEKIPSAEYNVILFANALIVNGEYQRCAHLIRTRPNKQSISSPLGRFLGFYALYMAGEKMKEKPETDQTEHHLKLQNPFLADLVREMSPLYVEVSHPRYIYLCVP